MEPAEASEGGAAGGDPPPIAPKGSKIIDADGFELVTSNGRKKRKLNGQKACPSASLPMELGTTSTTDGDYYPDGSSAYDMYSKLEYLTKGMRNNVLGVFYKGFCPGMKKVLKVIESGPKGAQKRITKIVCFGLGSLSNYSSRLQFAALQVLARSHHVFDIQREKVEFYDPAFTKMDIKVLTGYYFHKILPNDTVGQYELPKVPFDKNHDLTLFYMPHAPHELMNNLLYSNWSPDQLKSCIILGNSIEYWNFVNKNTHAYKEYSFDDFDRHPMFYLTNVETICLEHPISTDFHGDHEPFNQLAVHCFPSHLVKRCEDEDFLPLYWLKDAPPAKIHPET